MKMRIFAGLFFLAAMAVTPIAADTIFTFQTLPPGGAITGQPGQTVGWGYFFENLDSTDWLSVDSVSPTGSFSFGTFDSSIFDFPVIAPGSDAQMFWVLNNSGLGQFTWAPNAPIGTVNSGDFQVNVTWYTADPNTCSFTCTEPNPTQVTELSSYSVTAVPEPGTMAVFATGVLVLAIVRRRKRS